ncbi:MAG: lipid-A-disaccharide synthase N-terminal domain-containing protein [Terrimicrobiaceae bacterium]
MFRIVAALLALLALNIRAEAAGTLDEIGRQAEGVNTSGHVARFKIDLAGAKDNVKIVQLSDGSLAFVVKRLGPGTDRLLTPDEFAKLYYSQQGGGNWLSSVFNITSPAGIAWVALGLGGQLLFTGRMLVQWISSERSRRSVVPVAFWWMSLVGATMLLAYFIWRRDIVGVLGQATGWIIYIRNLVLINRSRA